jgi:phosphate transport system permease protein
MSPKSKLEFIVFQFARLVSIFALSVVICIIFFIIWQGLPRFSLDFIFKNPYDGMTKGGIFPAIIGTFLLVVLSCSIAFPLGVFAGIYMNEYAENKILRYTTRLMTQNLAGIPSIVFGLFGLSLFVKWLNLGVSLLSGSLTLAILILPVIIKTTEESLKAVDPIYRLTSYSLGASKIRTIFFIVLPMAFPSILTAFILSIGRVAGETAAIIFTAVAFYAPNIKYSIDSQVMALPYHIYVMATSGIDLEVSREIAFSTSLVLLILILILNTIAGTLRLRK